MASHTATAPVLVWLRRDLRLADNPALHAAAASGRPLIVMFVHETGGEHRLAPGPASERWMHRSLQSLDDSLRREHDGALVLRRGEARSLVPQLAAAWGVAEVMWNAAGLPWLDRRDAEIAQDLTAAGIRPRAFRAATLIDPERCRTGSGTPYRVFSAFWREARGRIDPSPPLPAPANFTWARPPAGSENLAALNLPAGDSLDPCWPPGERGALAALEQFCDTALAGYREQRDRPDLAATSRLSPHIAWGEVSVRTVRHRIEAQAEAASAEAAAEKFLAEIGWRDFAYYLVHHFGDLRRANFDRRFDAYPWQTDPDRLEAWQRGETGIPLVDAGMRQLRETGWMHNRVRMVTASYLIKHLNCHWRDGMAWFEEKLVDADPAVNAASWQWVAGCGADAAPFFRIFNPVLQGRKFDPAGAYVRRWVPELAAMPDRWLHAPWEAGGAAPADYPSPVVTLQEGRESALAAYRALKA